jgi:hypothetical protein
MTHFETIITNQKFRKIRHVFDIEKALNSYRIELKKNKVKDMWLEYFDAYFEIWLSKYYQTDEIIWPIQIWKRSECCTESIKEFYRVSEIFFAEYKNRKQS